MTHVYESHQNTNEVNAMKPSHHYDVITKSPSHCDNTIQEHQVMGTMSLNNMGSLKFSSSICWRVGVQTKDSVLPFVGPMLVQSHIIANLVQHLKVNNLVAPTC